MRSASLLNFTSLFAFVGLLQAAGCGADAATQAASGGSAGAPGGSAGASADGGAGPVASDAVVGSFIVELFGATDSAEGYTTLSGKVYDGVTPSTVIWDLLASGAGCELLKPRAPFCANACANGSVCVADDQCAGYAVAQDLGPVSVTGLGNSSITLKPIANSYQLPGDVDLPFPPAKEGAELNLKVSGGPFGAFSVATRLVAPLISSGSLSIDRERPLDLAWSQPGEATLGRIQIKVDISHHGGLKGKIECDVADSGALQIPAALITGLIDLGVAGFPSVTLTRVATGSTLIAPGKVTFQSLSTVTRELVVAGVQSCNEDSECPTGKPCKQDTKTCTQ